MKRLIWFVLFLVIGVSCLDQPDCFRQTYNLMGISFKKLRDGKTDTVYLSQYQVNNGVPQIVGNNKSLATYLELKLDYLNESTSYAIQTWVQDYDKKISIDYSLDLTHTSQAQYVSEECGTRFIVSNLNVKHHTHFDSLRLVSTALSNPSNTNIEVYRCPRMNVMRFSFRQLFIDAADIDSRGKLDPRQIDSITTGAGAILYKDTLLASVLLPLDKNALTSSYTFKFADRTTREIQVKYDTMKSLIVTGCPDRKIFSSLDTVSTSTSIKSKPVEALRVRNTQLNDPPATNIETYRCPTTNTINVLFRQLRGSSKVADTVNLKNLRADFLPDPAIIALDTTQITLSLNPDANINATTYTFEIDNVPHTFTLGYTTAVSLTHNDVCGALTIFTKLVLNSSDFAVATSVINIIRDGVSFPAANNVEIVKQN